LGSSDGARCPGCAYRHEVCSVQESCQASIVKTMERGMATMNATGYACQDTPVCTPGGQSPSPPPHRPPGSQSLADNWKLHWFRELGSHVTIHESHVFLEWDKLAPTDSVVRGCVIGLYFSADWCQPCRYGASLGGPLCDTYNPTLRIFSCTCLHTTSDDDQTRPKHTTQRPNKHHHHGGGAANPSGGVDLMNPRRLRGGWPCS